MKNYGVEPARRFALVGILLVALILLAVVSARPCFAQAAASTEADVLLVVPKLPPRLSGIPEDMQKRMDDDFIRETYETIARAGGTVEKTIPYGSRVVLRIKTKANELDSTERTLTSSHYFDHIQRNYFVYLCTSAATPNDPLFSRQNSLVDIDVLQAWTSSKGNMTVGLIDSGVAGITELSGKVTYASHDTSPGVDSIGHGTQVASVISALTYNGKEMAAVAPDSHIYSCKATTSKTAVFMIDSLIEGLTDCMAANVKIVNIGGNVRYPYTLSSATVHPVLHAVFDHFYRVHGGLIFVPSGNTGVDEGVATAPSSNPIVVDAVGTTVQHPSWATRSCSRMLDAPGENITAMDKFGKSVYVTGSSYSSAISAGVAALVWTACPRLSNYQVADALRSGGWTASGGRHTLSAKLAVDAGKSIEATIPPPPSPTPRPGPVEKPSTTTAKK